MQTIDQIIAIQPDVAARFRGTRNYYRTECPRQYADGERAAKADTTPMNDADLLAFARRQYESITEGNAYMAGYASAR